MRKFDYLSKMILSAAAFLALTATVALAKYPDRPITMIVAYSAGGGTDIAARTLAPYIEKYIGTSITVINKAGAGGQIGFTELAHSKPDGYTIGFINTPNVLTIPIQRKTKYSLKDLAPVANVVYDPGAFSMLATSKIKTLKDLIAFAKENPGAVTYGTTGIGSDDHLAALQFERQNGIVMTHIPYKGNNKVRAALLGGHIMMASMNISQSIDDFKDGKITIFGQMSEKRWEGAPQIPTFKEQGFDIIMGSDRGIGAPAGIDPKIVSTISDAVAKAIADPEFQEKAKKQSLPLTYMSAKEFTEHLEKSEKNFQKIWDETPWAKK
ncbi:tripartite tricarboxylate transporter substrate binding protein [Arcobacter sp.]|uniref:tripartite tricarboxylate transporter substrate binding protein n=1 Tax=unclassified Arcobacter TaxID=2593671 RepID=UPI003B003886|eukprot:TRINITY_DN17957_c0_g1_i1.p1 TRINITY_DN17957_c0_g1~~TRINITY_DN17957_c0_g1_i1.p1  ORF type:complete len:324 (-),score=-15.59 TRINITY_DN17957_c0_g1_i1:775-1746(-)